MTSTHPASKPYHVTPHFRWDEFMCHDGTPVPPAYRENVARLASMLEKIRLQWNRPITIISGFRTPTWNKRVNGETGSKHLQALAADIVIADVPHDDVADRIEEMILTHEIDEGGLGRYNHWTHYDVRGKRARWDER